MTLKPGARKLLDLSNLALESASNECEKVRQRCRVTDKQAIGNPVLVASQLRGTALYIERIERDLQRLRTYLEAIEPKLERRDPKQEKDVAELDARYRAEIDEIRLRLEALENEKITRFRKAE